MKARIRFPGEGEADKTLVKSGERYELAGDTVEVEPTFWSDKASPNLLFIETVDLAGRVLQKLMIRVKGADGRLQVIDRSKSVVPACDTVAATKPEVAEDDEYEEEEEEEDEENQLSSVPIPLGGKK